MLWNCLFIDVCIIFQMSSSTDREQSDEIMLDCTSDSDDFMLAYIAMELMNDNYDSCSNKVRAVPRVPGSVWIEIWLEDRVKCYETFRMRRIVFHLLHETLVT